MHICTQGEARVVVAEPLLDLFDVAAGVEEQRSAGVPEDVEAERRKRRSLRRRPQHPHPQVRDIERRSSRGRKQGLSRDRIRRCGEPRREAPPSLPTAGSSASRSESSAGRRDRGRSACGQPASESGSRTRDRPRSTRSLQRSAARSGPEAERRAPTPPVSRPERR